MKTKLCPKCGKELPLDNFAICKSTKSGRYSYCKTCKAAYMRKYRKENPEKIREIWKRSYDKHKDERLAHGREYSAKTYPLVRNEKYLKKYGISYDDKLEMLERVGYKCEICGSSVSIEDSQLDHDHATGDVRGILCMNCNMLLGHAKDDVNILKRAIEWLS